PTAYAGLPVAKHVPRESHARSPIILIRKVGARGSALVAGINQADRRIHETLRLQTWNERERAPLQVRLGRAVLVAHAQRESEVLAQVPLVLRESVIVLAANVRRSFAELRVVIRKAEEKIRQVVLRADPTCR